MVGIRLDTSYAGVQDEVVVITAKGYIDTTTSPQFSRLINELIAYGKYKYVMNLAGIDYISSTGWGVFIGNLKEIRDKGGDIVLANMVEGVHNIYELMEFSSILKSFRSLDSALEYFLREDVAEVEMEDADTFREEQEYEETGPQKRQTIQMYRTEEKEEWRAEKPEQKAEPAPTPRPKHKRAHGGEDGEGTIRVFRGKGKKKEPPKPPSKQKEEKRPYDRRREPSGGVVDEIERELGEEEETGYREQEGRKREQEKPEEVKPPSEKKAPEEEVEAAPEYYEEQEYVEEEQEQEQEQEIEEEEVEEKTPEEKFVEAPREKEPRETQEKHEKKTPSAPAREERKPAPRKKPAPAQRQKKPVIKPSRDIPFDTPSSRIIGRVKRLDEIEEEYVSGLQIERPPSRKGTYPSRQEYEPDEERKAGSYDLADLSRAKSTLGRRILRIILDHPYYDIRDISLALKLPEYGDRRASIITIRQELKEMGLLNKKDRYEFATKRRS